MPVNAKISDTLLGTSARPQIAYAEGIPEFENDAAEHWVFDTADSSCLAGRLHEKPLAVQDGANPPTYNPASITLPGVFGAGLLTPFTPRLDWSVLVIMKWPSGGFTNNGAQVFGNADLSTDGVSLLVSETGAGNEQYFTRVTGATGASQVANFPNLGFTDDAFYAIGASFDLSGGDGAPLRRVYANGASVDKTDDTGSFAAGTGRAPALGAAWYNNVNYTDALEVAELIYWERPLSARELESVAARSIVRWSRRGVSING